MQSPSPDVFFKDKKEIETNFQISLQYNGLPIEFSPIRITNCIVCVCLDGYAEIEVDLCSYHFTQNDIIIVFPGQILACNEKSDNFSLTYFSFSNYLIDEIMYRLPSVFISFLKESIKYNLPEEEKDILLHEYFYALSNKFSDTENICRNEIIQNLIHNFYLDLYNKVISKIQPRQRKRKEEVQEEFFRLVKTHIDNREVAFFAGKLCITPKYLSIITKETTGVSSKELIDKFAITELKLRLKSSSDQLKEIADQLNYPCEAFLCKFFKKHTGTTPSHYRNSSK